MVKILALYPSPHSHSLSSPTRPLSSLPVSSLFSYPSSLFSTRLLPLLYPSSSSLFSYSSPPSSLPVLLLPLLYPSLSLLYLSSLFSTRPPSSLSLLLPDLSLSISFTVPQPEIAIMGQVEGEIRLVMCGGL